MIADEISGTHETSIAINEIEVFVTGNAFSILSFCTIGFEIITPQNNFK